MLAKNNMTSSGLTCSFPTIFEPDQRMSASQKIYIMAGVPLVARNKKAVERVVRMDAMIATSFLNQRFRSKMMKNAVATAMIMDGSLIDSRFRPKIWRLVFCRTIYGKSTTLPCSTRVGPMRLAS